MPEIKPIKITVFASGRGSNFKAILDNIKNKILAGQIVCVISNRQSSGTLETAREEKIPAFHITDRQFATAEEYEDSLLKILKDHKTELVVLAGYMKLVPACIIRAFKNRILNIHPALLPSFGGQGMYGHHVHEAVLKYGCKISGATVHLIDEEYDTGPPVIQVCVPVLEDDTPDSLAERVLKIEHKIYSQAIQLFAENRVVIEGRQVKIQKKK